jgi:hypothetical protein
LWSLKERLSLLHWPQASRQLQEVTGSYILPQELPDLLQGGTGASHIQRDGEGRELSVSMLGDLHLEAITEGWDLSLD